MKPPAAPPLRSWIRRAGLALLMLAGSAAANSPDSIVVVMDDNYPPYVFRDSDGRLKGILPDEWALWKRKTGVDVNLKAMDWNEAKRVMQEGGADVIDTFFRTSEREQLYAFAPPYARIEVPVFADKNLGGIADVSSLQGFTVGVKAGDAVVEQLSGQGIDSLKEYPSYEAIVRAARDQEIKVFSIDQPAAVYYLYKYNIADQFRQSFVLYTGELHRAVQKNRPDMLNLVQGGFDRISSREHRVIEQKWMGTPFLLRTALREWAPWIMLAATALLLLAIVNLVLRRQVRTRTAELRQALDCLQHSQARLQSIFRVAPVGIGVLANRAFIEANDVLCKMSGYSREEIIGQSSRLFYETEEEFDRVGREFYAQIAREGSGTTEIHGKKKTGEIVHWILCGAPLDSTAPEKSFIFTVLDITERQKSEEQLRNSREYFATVFNSINEALFIANAATGQVLDVNRRMLDMYGLPSREEALAAGLGPISAGTPPYSPAEAAIWIRKAYTDGPQNFEWLAKRRDGHLFWVEMNIRRVQIGADDRMVVTARDITERKKTEDERLRYERRMQDAQKLESLGLLAGGIAHDFNNLLTAILGNIDLALLDIPHNSTARDDLRTAISATQRAAELAQQMLAYSGKGRFVTEWVEVPAAIQEITQMIKASISKNADLRMRFPPSLPPIEADATQLRQVVMNLVINASEALENRPGTIDLSAGVLDGRSVPPAQLWPREPLPPGPYLYIEIVDSGAGMGPDVLNKIFDPFFSTKFVGRGLGLPAVLGIVRGHKGAIQVGSRPGRGTTFRVFFPAKPKPATAAASPDAPVPGARTRSGLILLVDDESGVRETASKLLSRMGYQVTCAGDGEQAIQLFRSQADRIVGVILDLTMPQLDGVQTLIRLRLIRENVPVIISSGYGEQDVMQRFEGLHVNGFISKPYTLDGLRQALDQSLPG